MQQEETDKSCVTVIKKENKSLFLHNCTSINQIRLKYLRTSAEDTKASSPTDRLTFNSCHFKDVAINYLTLITYDT